jgi:hypothetical protein
VNVGSTWIVLVDAPSWKLRVELIVAVASSVPLLIAAAPLPRLAFELICTIPPPPITVPPL